jgi:putative radical SAM enzyme (TIGR03279 family)
MNVENSLIDFWRVPPYNQFPLETSAESSHHCSERFTLEQKGIRLSKNSGLVVSTVTADSIAEEIGIEVDDRIVSMNGREIKDILDYRFLVGEEKLLIEVIKPNGEVIEVDIEKELDEDLGIDFPEMKIRQCPNKCFFCFVDQMPEGQRESLYIRDEDYRFSFLFGNYITLTNLTRKDKERIFEQKMSPLYVSVHATDLELRRFLLVNPRARDILKEISEMAEHGIVMHTQIVLCPGINDGAQLSKSIEDLVRFYPSVASLAIVPVGLTRHREGLREIEEITPEYAREMLEWIKPWQRRFEKEIGYPFVFAADEWFIKANVPFPPLSAYLELPQLGNGVGMVPLFLEQFKSMRPFLPKSVSEPVQIFLATGASFSAYLEKCVKSLRIKGVELEVVTVLNHFFGDSVTMTGLITGKDIIKAVRESAEWQEPGTSERGDGMLLIPSVALNDEKTFFLDGTTPQEVEQALGLPVHIVSADAEGLMGFLQNIPAHLHR